MNLDIEQIKKYSPDVAESIHNLVKQLDDNYKPLSVQDIKDMLSSKNCFLVVAKNSQNKIVGMITLIIYRTPYTKKGILEDVVVDVDFRKQGIGTKLIQKAISKAKEEGVSSVHFTSKPSRESANQLYGKLGFKKRETNVYRLQL